MGPIERAKTVFQTRLSPDKEWVSQSVLTPSVHEDCHSKLLFSGSCGHVDATSGETQSSGQGEIINNSNRDGE
jgi:hypothetical protein